MANILKTVWQNIQSNEKMKGEIKILPGQKIVVVLLSKNATKKFRELIENPEIGPNNFILEKFKQLC